VLAAREPEQSVSDCLLARCIVRTLPFVDGASQLERGRQSNLAVLDDVQLSIESVVRREGVVQMTSPPCWVIDSAAP